MQEHEGDVELLWRACQSLKSLAYSVEHSSSKEAPDYQCALLLLIKSMDRYTGHLELQSNALGALMNLAYNNDSSKSTIHSYGGIKLIIQSMTSFPLNADIQNKGIK
jgi:hypothetical protein